MSAKNLSTPRNLIVSPLTILAYCRHSIVHQWWLCALIMVLHYPTSKIIFGRLISSASAQKSFEQSSRLIVSSLAILVSGITFLFLLPTYSRHSIMQQCWLCVPYQLISPIMVYCPHSQWLRALILAVLHPAKFSVVLLATVERKILSPAWRLRINSL